MQNQKKKKVNATEKVKIEIKENKVHRIQDNTHKYNSQKKLIKA